MIDEEALVSTAVGPADLASLRGAPPPPDPGTLDEYQ
jgi:hypothetical protein